MVSADQLLGNSPVTKELLKKDITVTTTSYPITVGGRSGSSPTIMPLSMKSNFTPSKQETYSHVQKFGHFHNGDSAGNVSVNAIRKSRVADVCSAV